MAMFGSPPESRIGPGIGGGIADGQTIQSDALAVGPASTRLVKKLMINFAVNDHTFEPSTRC